MTERIRVLNVPIAEGLIATVPYPMSDEDFEMLIATLHLWKSRLTRKQPDQNPATTPTLLHETNVIRELGLLPQ